MRTRYGYSCAVSAKRYVCFEHRVELVAPITDTPGCKYRHPCISISNISSAIGRNSVRSVPNTVKIWAFGISFKQSPIFTSGRIWAYPNFRVFQNVANGRQSFHAKEKGIEKRAGP